MDLVIHIYLFLKGNESVVLVFVLVQVGGGGGGGLSSCSE